MNSKAKTVAKKVIVGYDGSQESKHAVRWAALAAERRKAPLLVIATTGWDEVAPDLEASGLAKFRDQLIYEAAQKGAGIARETADIDVDALGMQQEAAVALQEHSHDAQLAVVGHRGRGRLRGTLLGSVAYAVTSHAKCPVVVVRGDPHSLPTADYPSVVAIDGSYHSEAILMLAARWAYESKTLLRIVVAWNSMFSHFQHAPVSDEEQQYYDQAESRAQHAANDIMQSAIDKVESIYPGLEIEPIVAEGRAQKVIIDASDDASLLIMGARGRGNLASLLLGSVSREVMERARCPVYIVR